LADCAPLILDTAIYNKLFGLGITGDAVNGRGPFDALHIEAVVFLPGGRFEFSRNLRDASGTVKAVIIPARDEFGELADLAALKALWRGVVGMFGKAQLAAPRIACPALTVFSDLSWLRNNRSGVVIIDPKRASWRLAAEQLVVCDTAFGARLREKLRLPAAKIFVRHTG
jgi:hypothetical protein